MKNKDFYLFCISSSFQKTEMYLEPIQISKMELFVKIVNSSISLNILTKCSVLDV